MKRIFEQVVLMSLFGSLLCWSSCKKDDNGNEGNSDKPVIENLAVNPASAVKFGDIVKLTGSFSDLTGLKSYTVKISNAGGDIWETTNMLTGASYTLNLDLVIPLPKNASAGDVKISVTLKNSGTGSETRDLTLASVSIPVFEQLYLIVGTKVYTLENVDGVFGTEDIIPANAVGKIYVNQDKTGMFWGMSANEIVAMGDGDISFGNTTEKYLTIAFNPSSFVFQAVESEEPWIETDDPIYILGNISGHYADGNITGENLKMKMQGYASGNKKYWTWTAPSTGSGDPADDMWGNIVPGSFRFKKGGAEEYILYDNRAITTGAANEEDKSFLSSAGGHFTIKLFFDGAVFNKVSLEQTDWETGSILKSLEYMENGDLIINGSPAPEAVSFAGTPLTLKDGTLHVYEGSLTLTKDQNITAQGTDLSTANPDPDVFSGKGNATWKMEGATGTWLIRIDPFASTIYACNSAGFPEVIYMDGWSWAKFDSDPAIAWQPENRLCLQRQSGNSYIYEATFYNFGWGGDVSFWAAPLSDPDYGKKTISSKYFDNVTAVGDGMLLPSIAGYYKVSVDLKQGFTFSEAEMDGNYFKLTPTGNNFTVTFTGQ
ncbi:MAG: DUF4625 domain-containing protein [Bacteroidales bacterium]|jgi:hypothetical protein|nr:DUF4625 domain-containing protein [Bacteroidales bacterium]